MSVFIDTSAWFANFVPSDPFHLKVVGLLRNNDVPCVTTDYVVDETLTLLRVRGEQTRAAVFGRRVFDLTNVNLVYVSAAQIDCAWQLFRDQPDRRWSFTDCTSKVVMDERHIHRAVTLDNHFREFGGIEVLP